MPRRAKAIPRVILDSSLAEMYGVQTGALVQAVKRNPDRFPNDFMFQLTRDELANLKSQYVMSSAWGGRRTRPYAFTEQGVAMLLDALEQRYDEQFRVVFEAIRALISEEAKPRKRIGFVLRE